MIDKNNLPPSWAIAKFEDLLDYIQPTEYIVASTEYDDKYKTPVLTAGKSFIKGYTNETNGIFDALPVIIFDDFTTATQFVNFPFKVKSSAMKILKPTSDLVNIKLAFYFMQTVHLKSETHKRYWISEYSKLPIPLPPEKEQQRIFDKLEEVFTNLDKGIENLKTAKQQLKIYRQSVLKWAFEGKLTNKNIVDGELPKGWHWKKSNELFSFVTSGSRGWAKYYSNSGAIFIRITNLDFDSLDIDLAPEKIQYVNPPNNSEGLRTKVQEGDFLFSITGYLGMFAIAPKLENAFVNQHIALCRPKNDFNSKYVGYWIIAKSGGHHYLNKLQKGATKAGLGLDDIKDFPVPIAPILEQEKIVKEIESRLSVCDKIEEAIESSLQQSQALRISIIKKGFEGKLVKQNPKDESAEILLAKIRAEIKKNNPDKPVKELKTKKKKLQTA